MATESFPVGTMMAMCREAYEQAQRDMCANLVDAVNAAQEGGHLDRDAANFLRTFVLEAERQCVPPKGDGSLTERVLRAAKDSK
jgi:hypothetical protein